MSTVLSPFPEYTPPPPDPPAQWCTACRDRAGKQVPVYRAGLCETCFNADDDGVAVGPDVPIFLWEQRVQKLVADTAKRHEAKRERRRLTALSAQGILEAVAEHYDTPMESLVSKIRAGFQDEPRHVARYLLRELMKLSFPEIGRIVHSHHTCVMRSINQVEMRPKVYGEPIRELRKKLEISSTFEVDSAT